jgi:isopenicillin-N epimerase
VPANPIWGNDWEEVRRLWLLDPAVAHCNHGSFGAVPEPVFAEQEAYRRRMVVNPMEWFHGEMPPLIVKARGEVAEFIGARPEDTAFVHNVTVGVSAVLASLDLHPGDEVVSTNHIYGAVNLAVERLCARTGAVRAIAAVPLGAGDEEIAAAVLNSCNERTALVVIDQITSPTARLFPVQAITAAAHELGAAVLVDGAHAIGMLPVDVPSIGADFWTANLHKWPCAPAGSGVLWVDPAWQSRVQPTVVSHGDREGFPLAFDRVGTDDLTAWITAPSALRLLAELGWTRVRRHNELLVRMGQMTVGEALDIPSDHLRHDPGLSLALVPLPVDAIRDRDSAQDLQRFLTARGVEVTIPAFAGQHSIRLSAHVYNCPEDYERVAAGVVAYLSR